MVMREHDVDWESHVEYVDRSSWRQNGLRPPPRNTAAERHWIVLNRPAPYSVCLCSEPLQLCTKLG